LETKHGVSVHLEMELSEVHGLHASFVLILLLHDKVLCFFDDRVGGVVQHVVVTLEFFLLLEIACMVLFICTGCLIIIVIIGLLDRLIILLILIVLIILLGLILLRRILIIIIVLILFVILYGIYNIFLCFCNVNFNGNFLLESITLIRTGI
jgi:hypothetical protein